MKRVSVVLLLGLLTSCAGNSRQQALTTALTTLNAMRDALVAFDEPHQAQIVAAAKSLEDGKAKLAAYRANRDHVAAALLTAYSALALAAADSSGDRLKLAFEALLQVQQMVQCLTGSTSCALDPSATLPVEVPDAGGTP
jgi:hypothetical protein